MMTPLQRALAGPMYGAGGPVQQSLAGLMGSPQAQEPVPVPPAYDPVVTRGQLLPVGRMESGAGPMYGAGGPVAQSLAGSMDSPQAQMPVVVPPPLGADVYRGQFIPFALTESGQTRPALPQFILNAWKNAKDVNRYATGQEWADPRQVSELALNLAGTGYAKGVLSGLPPKGTFAQSSWHGGPNKWAPEPGFPQGRPRLDKMGTGEGAQAYGWGFYSADKKDVGKGYMDHLGGGGLLINDKRIEMPVGGGGSRSDDFLRRLNKSAAQNYRDNGQRSLGKYGNEEIESALSEAGRYATDAERKELMEFAETFRDAEISYDPAGQLYHLDLPDEDVAKYLDWDAPLSEQPANVKKSLSALLERINAGRVERFGPGGTLISKEHFMKMTGEDLQDHLAVTFGRSERAVSEALRRAGIPGLKYFDQQSRVTARGKILDVFQDSGGWRSKIKVSNRGGVGFNTPADMFTTSNVFDTETAARAWANEKIGGGTRNYVTWDQDVLDRVKILEQP